MFSESQLQAEIEQAAAEAYEIVAQYKRLDPDTIHRAPQCIMVTDYLIGLLRESGLKVGPVSSGGEQIMEHRYIKLGNKIIDATWQQFIPESDDDDLPKVYYGSPEGLQDLAALNGADESALKLWDKEGQPRVTSVQERIAKAIDDNMA